MKPEATVPHNHSIIDQHGHTHTLCTTSRLCVYVCVCESESILTELQMVVSRFTLVYRLRKLQMNYSVYFRVYTCSEWTQSKGRQSNKHTEGRKAEIILSTSASECEGPPGSSRCQSLSG